MLPTGDSCESATMDSLGMHPGLRQAPVQVAVRGAEDEVPQATMNVAFVSAVRHQLQGRVMHQGKWLAYCCTELANGGTKPAACH